MESSVEEQGMFVEVAVPLPLRDLLTYRLPKKMNAEVGVRVLVPLGPRRVTGYVVGLTSTPPEGFKIRDVLDVLDASPLFSPDILKLCKWVTRYYHEGLGEVIATALPGGLNQRDARVLQLTSQGRDSLEQGEPVPEALRPIIDLISDKPRPVETLGRQLRWTIHEVLRATQSDWIESAYALRGDRARKRTEKVAVFVQDIEGKPRSKKDAEVFEAIQSNSEMAVTALNKAFKNVRNNLLRLEENGAIRVEERRVFRDVLGNRSVLPATKDVRPELTPEQVPAVQTLQDAVRAGTGKFLLHGVTGSGKTEVYLRAIETVLEAGKSAIVLVPEIALTPQLAARFQGRFGDSIALLHSGLSNGERLDQWTEIAQGRRSVVVGARSAIFAPVPDLGLVVVDEEHESSFKQETRPRYHARDLAMVRGAQSGCPVVLGSATPCMESLFNGRHGRYQVLEMKERVMARPLPSIEVVDLRTGRAKGKNQMVSPILAEAIQETLNKGQQVIIFINRRGFSSFVLCADCGFVSECPSCSISLSYTRRYDRVRCHYCGFSRHPPTACESCKGTSFEAVGSGTERVEEELRQIIGPQIGIGRLDRDTATGKGLLEVLTDFRDRRTRILIGTQMVAKGHDFPGVTLVGVLQADQGLRFPEFRASERTYQLLTQVAGRAGRGETPGRVLIQSYMPDHYVIDAVTQQEPGEFVSRELEERKNYGYPPFSYLALILITHEDSVKAQDRALECLESLRSGAERENAGPSLVMLGPTFAPIQRLKNRTRLQILLKCSDRDLLHRILSHFEGDVGDWNYWSSVAIDVDPMNLL